MEEPKTVLFRFSISSIFFLYFFPLLACWASSSQLRDIDTKEDTGSGKAEQATESKRGKRCDLDNRLQHTVQTDGKADASGKYGEMCLRLMSSFCKVLAFPNVQQPN